MKAIDPQARILEIQKNTQITNRNNDFGELENYDCQKCKDTGAIKTEKGHAICDCVKEKAIKNKISAAEIPERFKDARLSNFETKCHDHEIAFCHAKALVANIDRFITNNWGLYIDGPPSQGKTRLQASIVNELCVDRGYLGIMVNVRKLLSDIKDAVGDNSLNEILDAIQENKIIAFNDLTGGKRSNDSFTSFERGIIYRLVDAAYEEQKSIIISSKFNYEWVGDKLGRDVKDRLIEMCGGEITMTGYNWRKKAGKERDQQVENMVNQIKKSS